MRFTRLPFLSALTFAIVALTGISADAGITGFDAYGNLGYTQTANNTAPLAPPIAFFDSRIFYDTPGDVTSANGTSSGQPLPGYTPQDGNFALSQTGFLTPGQLNPYITGGSLQFNVTSGTLGAITGISPIYPTTPLFSGAVPFLTGNSYNLLQGLDASKAATVTFNGFTPVAGANESDVFATVFNATTGEVVYSQAFFGQPGTTSFGLAAGLLSASTDYVLELDYSSRLNTNGIVNGLVTPFTFGYDRRTDITFTTATPNVVPEPASMAMLALGLGGVGIAARRRKRGV